VLQGAVEEEAADRASLVLVSAVLALNNAGQYQALLHEVEKRQEVVKQLGAALEFKTEFVANISHEVRTPIYSFIGFAELLAGEGYGELNEEQAGVVKRMLENAEHLLEMINNILDHARMESGEFRIRCTQQDLKAFVSDIAETCRPLVKDKAVSIHATCDEHTPVVVIDWCILRQIALNLVSNAIKFTEVGRVEIKAGYDETEGAIFLNVLDTGVGMDPKRISDIFEPFRQLENSYTKKYAGTGLGLAITKKQIEMLGGTISVQSEEGKGAQFSVVFPVKVEMGDSGVNKLFSSMIGEDPVHTPAP
jgi:signal transduction histidine kinase